MRVLTRALATLGLAALAGATSLSAQSAGVGAYRFYVGASGGGMNFETAEQTRGTIPMFGGNALITAKRAALLVAVDIGLGSSEAASMPDAFDDQQMAEFMAGLFEDKIAVTRELLSAAENASITRREYSTSSLVGDHAALAGSTWLGWISVLPSKPIWRPWRHSASKPSASLMSL